VLVIPQVSAESASVLAVFMVNPAVGLGSLLGQLLLKKQLQKLLSYEYDVIGSWASPQVKKHESAKPAAPGAKTDSEAKAGSETKAN